MNIKDEHTSRLWTFIMKGEIMDLDDHELIATRVNNKAASWKEVEEYIEKHYMKKDKIKEKIKELNKKRIHYENDNTNKIFIREFTRKYTKKEDDDFGIFNIQEAITYMTNNEYLARIAELQELLIGDK